MNISVEWLSKKNACEDAIVLFKNQAETDSLKILHLLIESKNLEWANWLIVRIMDYRQCVLYAIFAAGNVIDKFEKIYLRDKRPQCAIATAKERLKSKEIEASETASEGWGAAREAALKAENVGWEEKIEEKSAGWPAESEAWTAGNEAARSAWMAESEAWSAENAEEGAGWAMKSAESAAWTAADAAWAVHDEGESAGWSAGDAAKSAGWAARSAGKSAAVAASEAMQLKILNYGVKLLEDQT